MEKEFLDYMYDQRASVQAEIDDLVDRNKNTDSHKCCDDMVVINSTRIKIDVKRNQIFGINKSISKYLELHHYIEQ